LSGTWSDFSTATFTWQKTTPIGRIYTTSNSSVFYVTSGMRDKDSANGSLNYIGSQSCIWTATPYNGVTANNFSFTSSRVNAPGGSSKAYCLSVRCSQE
ncbi:MAG: hypothetical protein LBL97_05850, partial [Prevotellaceae bacterium]|nr:hypothetical protein [Prevotellaceae bacterium]